MKNQKDETLELWRKVYKGRHGIPESREVPDSEIFEQFAIEHVKGTLFEWINTASNFKLN